MIKLSDKVVFYLPGRTKSGEELPNSRRWKAHADFIEPFMVEAGGGTELAGWGMYLAPATGQIETETINTYTVFVDDLHHHGGQERVFEIAGALRDALEQSAVAVEINGALYLV